MIARVAQVVVLASVAALVPEVSVSDMWGMLLPVVQCPCDTRPVCAMSCSVLAL